MQLRPSAEKYYLGYVRYWHLASFAATHHFVRYWTKADKVGFSPAEVCPLMTHNGSRAS